MKLLDRITLNPNVMGGRPCIRGLRVTVGMITGAIYAQYALGSYWRWDPKEVWSLITWLFYAALLHERLAVGLRGRRAALLSIVSFSILLFTFLGASLWLSDYHSFRSLGGAVGP